MQSCFTRKRQTLHWLQLQYQPVEQMLGQGNTSSHFAGDDGWQQQLCSCLLLQLLACTFAFWPTYQKFFICP